LFRGHTYRRTFVEWSEEESEKVVMENAVYKRESHNDLSGHCRKKDIPILHRWTDKCFANMFTTGRMSSHGEACAAFQQEVNYDTH
jgi:hypothetical protein